MNSMIDPRSPISPSRTTRSSGTLHMAVAIPGPPGGGLDSLPQADEWSSVGLVKHLGDGGFVCDEAPNTGGPTRSQHAQI